MPLSFRWGAKRSSTGMADSGRDNFIDTKAVAAEFIAMFLFVIIGCGTACGHGAADASQRLVVAFAFGMSIMVLAYTIGHHSGGQINCAVTLTLVIGGQVRWMQGLANFGAQLLGSILGAVYLAIMFPCFDQEAYLLTGTMSRSDMTGGGLGSNAFAEGDEVAALFGEFIGTFILCYVVWETAVNPDSGAGKNACIAIGFAVFLSHVLLLPIDGCSINPTRSIGPYLIAAIRNCEETDMAHIGSCQWVTWVGPLLGAAAAAGLKKAFLPGSAPADQQAGDLLSPPDSTAVQPFTTKDAETALPSTVASPIGNGSGATE